MTKISTNPAIVDNNTFNAANILNLNHYDISNALQTTLEFNKLIPIFSNKIESMIPHSAFVYTNAEFGLEIKSGVFTRYSCSYALKVEEQQLGELKLLRNHRFDDAEIKLLETLLCCLIYPLKNATLFHRALNMAYTNPHIQTNNGASFNDSVKPEMSRAAIPESILVVEDDEEIAMLLEFLLSREGYQVTLAKDGYAAQHFIEHSVPPVLVLLDVMLPYVSGTHLLAQIRNTPIWANTQIVMLSAKSGEREVVGALNLGADDFISKPFKPMELVARVNHRLKSKKTAA